jgi:3-deoxy-D-manno-octulosonate 8-phosphate phosphatase (KDO 8-P phosphatase)
MNVLSHFKNIKLFVLDVDGVLTDGSLLLLNDGEMVRRMHVKDGYAMQLAIKRNYQILIISGGISEAVKMRLEKLGIANVYFGITNKKDTLLEYVSKNNIAWPQVLYMGDDIPDMQPMQMAGVACCPADAAAEVKAISHYISYINGGNGCVRDVIEKVLKLNGDWIEDTSIASK